MKPAPFFIVGSGRSGTTLLRMILASHSRISIPPETYFLLPLLSELPANRVLTRAEVERAVQIMTGHYRWPDFDVEADAFAREASQLAEPTLRAVVEIVYEKHFKQEGKVRWGDKTPPYIRIVPQLDGLFPGASFIHLLRDGRDVAKSFQSVGWYGPQLHKNMGEWNGAMALDRKWRAAFPADRYLLVRYEDLVRQTERTTRNICAFLGEQFEPQMLGWEEKVDRLVPRREQHIHEKLRRKPHSQDVERWRRDMTSWEVFVSEAFMGPALSRAGYERRFGSVLWSPVFLLTRFHCRFVIPLIASLARGLHARENLGAQHKKPVGDEGRA